MRHKINVIFITIFLLCISLPYLFAHRVKEDRVSTMENRMLAKYPSLFSAEGTLNREYISEYEAWLDDNLRGRNVLVEVNSTLQYQLFNRIVKSDTIEGKDHWLFASAPTQILEYQHLNLLSESELALYITNMQKLSNYLKEKGIAFYYFPCYDKETIYPEKYMEGINQIGTISRTDQIENALQEKTDVKLISTKDTLIEHANEGVYFSTVDLTHWNTKGAYLGYQVLIQELKKDFAQIPLLSESDFLIEEKEERAEIYGFPYPYPETYPVYSLKAPQAVEVTEQTKDRWEFLYFKEHTHMYVNESCPNNMRILVLGDSFVRMYLKDRIAENFYETLSIDWLNISILDDIVEEYCPDIVIIESAQSALDNTIKIISEIDFV